MSLNRALQRDLDVFFTKIQSSEFTIREVTKGAFTQARAKLNEWGFRRLNEVAAKGFYDEAEYYVWNGHRTLAVDGTRLTLPNHKSIKEEFGECFVGPKADRPHSIAIASMLYDVLNHITLDADLTTYKTQNDKSGSERKLLESHIDKLESGDLLLLDRGYPAIWLFYLLKAKRVDFCVRMRTNWWKDVKSFVESGDQERLVDYQLPKKDYNRLKDYPEYQRETIKCRFIRVELDNGEVEVLCTSLIDTNKYNNEHFKELYHYRWNQEEAYKLLKSRIELENFTGKTAKAVKQDFHAKILLLTLTAAYAQPVEDRVREEYKADQHRKHSQQINRTNAIFCTRNILINLFHHKRYQEALRVFDDLVFKTREIVRPNRKNPRQHRPKKQYAMNYKRL